MVVGCRLFGPRNNGGGRSNGQRMGSSFALHCNAGGRGRKRTADTGRSSCKGLTASSCFLLQLVVGGTTYDRTIHSPLPPIRRSLFFSLSLSVPGICPMERGQMNRKPGGLSCIEHGTLAQRGKCPGWSTAVSHCFMLCPNGGVKTKQLAE